MKHGTLLIAIFCFTLKAYSQTKNTETPVFPSSDCHEAGKVEWNGYDKKKSFRSHPYAGEDLSGEIADSTARKQGSSIHNQEWKKENATKETPCSKAKPPINF